MLLNCGVEEDSWESVGLQGDPTSPSYRKSVLNIHWKDWCWSWNSKTLATRHEELTHWKRAIARKDWRQEEKGMTEDEMVGWHHWLDGPEFEQASEVGNGRENLSGCSPWGHNSRTWLSDWTELNWKCSVHFYLYRSSFIFVFFLILSGIPFNILPSYMMFSVDFYGINFIKLT